VTEVRPRVVFVDGVPMSGLVAAVEEPKAVVVAFHGGSSTAAYFDCPGHPSLSLLRMGADNGYTVVALDRPGYGSSAPYPDAMERPEQRIALAYGAIDKILGAGARGAGLFLVGHSAGCELVVRMATDDRAEQSKLIGLELAGTGVQYDSAMAEIMKSASATNRPTGLREVLW
jgi:pimeloyl-ACP methyl ester carboxylesterase